MASTISNSLRVFNANPTKRGCLPVPAPSRLHVSCQLGSSSWQRPSLTTREANNRGRFAALSSKSQEEILLSASEEADWRRRQEESKSAAEEEGRSAGDSDQWRWTLNWDAVTPDILVGSCPRSAQDIDTIADKAGVTAVVNLQSDVCFDALHIPFPEIKQRATERGVFLARVPVRDFDHGDQAAMLPEAVRVVNVLLSRGHRVYLHCTAGINRAPLVALAYLYFIQGCRRDEAQKMVKTARAIANPYLDCLTEAKRRLLEGRDEELTSLATEIYEQRCNGTGRGDASSDWSGAQSRALARSFAKYLVVDLGMMDTERDILESKWQQRQPAAPVLPDALQTQLQGARALVQQQKAKIAQLRDMVGQWEQEEAQAEARAKELEAALKRAGEGQAPAVTVTAGTAVAVGFANGGAKKGGGLTNGKPRATNGTAFPAKS